jgi:hypothetical protein
MFFSKKRVWAAVILSLALIFYFFNFVQRNIDIIETRSIARKIFDYGLNFAIFFVAIYLALTLLIYLYKLVVTKK